jgi:hypothetical protein
VPVGLAAMIHGFHSLQNKEGEETTLFP